MNRREVVGKVASSLMVAAIPRGASAQTAAKPASFSTPIAVSSGNLKWLRTPDDVARAAIEAGFGAVTVTVGPLPAHVQADGVGLTEFAAGLRGAGLMVDTISCPADLDRDAATMNRLLGSAKSAGIKYYVFGPYPYVPDKPVRAQIDGFRQRLSALAGLNAHYDVRGLYRNCAGHNFGAALFDAVEDLHSLDPHSIGLCYDTGQGALAGGGGSWAEGLRAAGPYFGALFCTDFSLHFQLDTDQGGIFTGTPEELATNTSAKIRHPYGGGGGQTNPWTALAVPLGTGLVDLPQLAAVVKEIGIQVPLTIQSDYLNGGAENGGSKLTLPRAMVLGAIKRDLLTLNASLVTGGLL